MKERDKERTQTKKTGGKEKMRQREARGMRGKKQVSINRREKVKTET